MTKTLAARLHASAILTQRRSPQRDSTIYNAITRILTR